MMTPSGLLWPAPNRRRAGRALGRCNCCRILFVECEIPDPAFHVPLSLRQILKGLLSLKWRYR